MAGSMPFDCPLWNPATKAICVPGDAIAAADTPPWRTCARQFMLATMRTGLADRRSGARGVQPSNMHKLHVEVPDLQPSSLLLRGSALAHTGMSQNAKGSRHVSVCLMSQGAEALPGRCAFR
jgi:hypothetical protein